MDVIRWYHYYNILTLKILPWAGNEHVDEMLSTLS